MIALFLAIVEKVRILMCEINELGFMLASNGVLSLCYASGGPVSLLIAIT